MDLFVDESITIQEILQNLKRMNGIV